MTKYLVKIEWEFEEMLVNAKNTLEAEDKARELVDVPPQIDHINIERVK